MKKLVPILLVLVVLALGCKYVTSLKDAASGGSAPGSSGGADPKADIAEASKKFIALPAFTAHMEGSGTQNAMKYQVEYAAPDRYHITYQGGTGAGMELI